MKKLTQAQKAQQIRRQVTHNTRRLLSKQKAKENRIRSATGQEA